MAAAVLAAAIPLPAGVVERYSTGGYLALQHVVTATSNGVRFALFDALLGAAVAAWTALAWRDLRRARPRWRGVSAVLGRTTVWTAVTYLAFLAMWGLNYRRVPLIQKLEYRQSAVTADAALAAAHMVVERLNALHGPAHAAGWPSIDVVDKPLAEAFARAAAEVHLPPSTVPARPKATMLDLYFRRSGTDGMTDPFFLETLVATSVLPFERPLIIAHEWSHLAGIGDEGEANFVGWLTCVRGGPAAQYSGALFLYRELLSAVPEKERSLLAASVSPGPRADLREIRARYERDVSPRLSEVGWRVYDSYLRANRVEAGAASYAEVVKLVLGVKLAQGW